MFTQIWIININESIVLVIDQSFWLLKVAEVGFEELLDPAPGRINEGQSILLEVTVSWSEARSYVLG